MIDQLGIVQITDLVIKIGEKRIDFRRETERTTQYCICVRFRFGLIQTVNISQNCIVIKTKFRHVFKYAFYFEFCFAYHAFLNCNVLLNGAIRSKVQLYIALPCRLLFSKFHYTTSLRSLKGPSSIKFHLSMHGDHKQY